MAINIYRPNVLHIKVVFDSIVNVKMKDTNDNLQEWILNYMFAHNFTRAVAADVETGEVMLVVERN